MNEIIKAKNLTCEYIRRGKDGEALEEVLALDHINLTVGQGEFVAIVGPNGCGKSTLARHLGGLMTPQEGAVFVGGLDTSDPDNFLKIRQIAGQIFQNPDNQIVASVVEEDVAFGPENIGLSSTQIESAVTKALEAVSLSDKRFSLTNNLSGGEKQRLAIAGALAFEPKVLILDEPTSMLDENGRSMVMDAIEKIRQSKGMSIVLITHFPNEAYLADTVYEMKDGKLRYIEDYKDVFSREYKRWSFDLSMLKPFKNDDVPILIADHISSIYDEGTTFANEALRDVNLSVYPGQILALCGKSGAGKSTLIQILSGLAKPTSGTVYFEGVDIFDAYDMRNLRKKMGILFQYSDDQLFEETVFDDVKFGPKQLGLDEKQAYLAAHKALERVGMPRNLYLTSPLSLSGGQKRLAALAAVMANQPSILILDEPTSALDAEVTVSFYEMIVRLKSEGCTILIITHVLEDAYKYCDRIVFMDEGQIVADGTP